MCVCMYVCMYVGVQLNEYADELDCIWSVGLAPDTVPVGHIPGTAISIANTGFYNKLAAQIYRGDFAFEADCGVNFGFLLLAPIDHPSGTAVWKVQSLPPSLGPVQAGEYMDDRAALTFDFSAPVPPACEDNVADMLQEVKKSSKTDAALLGGLSRPAGLPSLLADLYPLNLFFDMVRIVGKQSDGKLLWLGRTLMKPAKDGDGLATFMYFSLTSDDPRVNPELRPGFSVGPSVGFSFSRQLGGEELLVRAKAPLFRLGKERLR
eukprot:GHVU01224309.1.p1 GENE.GHVU01224309.1~~GHVU01224309.1.p1  ORF type:complete len:264 (+),score=39.46 GHVU01224309.1:2531-3322(+)